MFHTFVFHTFLFHAGFNIIVWEFYPCLFWYTLLCLSSHWNNAADWVAGRIVGTRQTGTGWSWYMSGGLGRLLDVWFLIDVFRNLEQIWMFAHAYTLVTLFDRPSFETHMQTRCIHYFEVPLQATDEASRTKLASRAAHLRQRPSLSSQRVR